MFERFSEQARQVVVVAHEEARGLKHNYIGTEHLLLGLVRDEDGVAAQVLQSLGLALEGVREQIVGIVGLGDEVTTDRTDGIPFTPRAKKVLERALREALSLGHNHIGSEHILLGLMCENEGVAVRVLRDFDVDSDEVRTEVIRLVNAAGYRPPTTVPESWTSTTIYPQALQADPQAQASAIRRCDLAACRALELALADALRRGHQSITCENLLAGLAAHKETLAGRILGEHGLDADQVRIEVDRQRDS